MDKEFEEFKKQKENERKLKELKKNENEKWLEYRELERKRKEFEEEIGIKPKRVSTRGDPCVKLY